MAITLLCMSFVAMVEAVVKLLQIFLFIKCLQYFSTVSVSVTEEAKDGFINSQNKLIQLMYTQHNTHTQLNPGRTRMWVYVKAASSETPWINILSCDT